MAMLPKEAKEFTADDGVKIKYIDKGHDKENLKRTILSINMIGNEKQKTWQKNTIFKSKMLKGLCPC